MVVRKNEPFLPFIMIGIVRVEFHKIFNYRKKDSFMYSVINHLIRKVQKTSRVSLSPRDINKCMNEKFKYEKFSSTATSVPFASFVDDMLWSRIKGEIEGVCVEEGLVLKSNSNISNNLLRTSSYVIPEHLNGNVVSSIKYTVSIFSPDKDSIVFVKITGKCHIGAEGVLVPYLPVKLVTDGSPLQELLEEVEDEKIVRPIQAQFRSHPVQVLLPLQLHLEKDAELLSSLQNGDHVLVQVKAKKYELFDKDVSLIGKVLCIVDVKDVDEDI
jgi:hypothetical protein